MSTSLVVAEAVTKDFVARRGGRVTRAVRAVDDVSFTVGAGEALAVVGESGSGKTTLARMLVGLTLPSAGRVRVDGADMSGRLSPGARRAVQLVSQNPWSALNRRRTVGHAIALPLRVHGLVANRAACRARVEELLGLVGLDAQYAERLPAEVSGGELQRVTIARALGVGPRVLVMDEPTASLDAGVKAAVVSVLTDLRAQLGLSYVLVTHELDVARYVADRVVVMRSGRVVEAGAVDVVLGTPAHAYTRLLLDARPMPDPTVPSGPNAPGAGGNR